MNLRSSIVIASISDNLIRVALVGAMVLSF